MKVDSPENDTSIPLTMYGSSMNFFPLKTEMTQSNSSTEWVGVSVRAPTTTVPDTTHTFAPLDVLAGEHFDIVPRTRVVRESEHASKAIQAIAHCNVDRLAKDTVAA